jgi:hypothetical protein
MSCGHHFHLPIAMGDLDIIKTIPTNQWIFSVFVCYTSRAFNENLHEQFSDDLAGTSWPVKPRPVQHWAIKVVSRATARSGFG